MNPPQERREGALCVQAPEQDLLSPAWLRHTRLLRVTISHLHSPQEFFTIFTQKAANEAVFAEETIFANEKLKDGVKESINKAIFAKETINNTTFAKETTQDAILVKEATNYTILAKEAA